MDYLIDTHCHLHDQEWFTPEQSEQFLLESAQNDVKQVIVIGTDPEDSRNAQHFAQTHAGVYCTYGVHPEYADQCQALDIKEIAKSIRPNIAADDSKPNQVLVAIGEIGLDYHYEGYNRERQIKLFEQMLQLAQDLGLPVSLHIREAFADAWPILDNFPKITGVVHSFTGSKKELRKALERDFYVGVNGLVTYTTPALPPLEKMLLETDAPFLTPVPFRGTINKPGYVRNIATYLAEKLGEQEVKIVEQTTQNARQLFKLGDVVIRSTEGI